MAQSFDAVIIGGGIAGSSIAFALASRGWTTLLLDQHTFPRHKVCGEFMSPESQSIFVSLGLTGYIEPLQPPAIHAARLTTVGGVSLELTLPGQAFGISRYKLDHLLHQAAIDQGAQVETGVTVSSVYRYEQGYRVEMVLPVGNSHIDARVVIGAWGRHARAGLSGNENPKATAGQAFVGVKAHYQNIRAIPVVELFFFAGGYIGLSPVEGGKVNAAALLTREAFARAGKTALGVMEAAARQNPSFRERLGQAKPVPGTLAAVAPVVISRRLDAWGMIPQAGDAAVVIPPLCGDGMAVALKSAELCVRYADSYLRGMLTMEEWRCRYTEELTRVSAGMLHWGRMVHLLLGKPALSALLLRAGRLFPGLADRIVRATRLSE